MFEAVGSVTCVLHSVAGDELGFPHDLGALHHALGPGARRRQDVVSLSLHLAQELLAFAQEPAGLAQLVG